MGHGKEVRGSNGGCAQSGGQHPAWVLIGGLQVKGGRILHLPICCALNNFL